MTYGKSVLIAFDQLINALCGGMPDETLSSRAWREEQDGVRAWPRRLIDWLASPWESDHCHDSYLSEVVKNQFPPELRK